jgi:hypothetical protein
MAKKLWFAARWMPGRLRNQQAQLLNADEVLGSP